MRHKSVKLASQTRNMKIKLSTKLFSRDLPHGPVVKNPPTNAGERETESRSVVSTLSDPVDYTGH